MQAVGMVPYMAHFLRSAYFSFRLESELATHRSPVVRVLDALVLAKGFPYDRVGWGDEAQCNQADGQPNSPSVSTVTIFNGYPRSG